MEGIVKAIVKDKNGNIKHEVVQHNTIFDFPAQYVNDILEDRILNFSNKSIPSDIFNIKRLFSGIRLNEDAVSETDMYDFVFPIMSGNASDSYVASDWRHSKVSSSTITGSTFENIWNWNVGENVNIKSLNLCNQECMKYFLGHYSYIDNYDNKYYACQDHSFWINSTKKLLVGKNSTDILDYSTTTPDITKNIRCPVCQLKIGSYSSFSLSYVYILQNGEIAFLRDYNDMTTNSTLSKVKYIVIIDATTMALKRSFAITQLEEYALNTGGIDPDGISIVSNSVADYMLVATSTKSVVYKIPRAATTATINIFYTCTMSMYPSIQRETSSYQCIASCSNSFIQIIGPHKILKVNSNDTFAEKSYRVMNLDEFRFSYSSSSNACGSQGQLKPAGYKWAVCDNDLYNYFPLWPASSVLNFKNPLSILSGETLTIKYSVVFN